MRDQQDTPLDAALRVAHAVWHVAGALLVARPKDARFTRSLCDLNPVHKMGRVRTGCLHVGLCST